MLVCSNYGFILLINYIVNLKHKILHFIKLVYIKNTDIKNLIFN